MRDPKKDDPPKKPMLTPLQKAWFESVFQDKVEANVDVPALKTELTRRLSERAIKDQVKKFFDKAPSQ